MLKWPLQVKSYSPSEVHKFVADPSWQMFRKRMKGHCTDIKLDMLYQYRNLLHEEGIGIGISQRSLEVQIDNYLQALRRGGFLDPTFTVRK